MQWISSAILSSLFHPSAMKKLLLFVVTVSSFGLLSAAPLTFERSISLGEVRGRIDHLALDAARGRLFVSALGNDTVEVVDLRRNKVVHTIPGLSEPQGIVYVPSLNRLYVANGGDGTLRVYDGATFAGIKSLPLGGDADNARYDAAAQRLYVGFGSGALAIVDVAGDELVGTIALAAHPESFQLETHGPRVFINVPQAGNITVANRAQDKIVATWTPGAGGNFPMALDEADHRLFVGCRDPARLLVLDTGSGRQLARLELHRDCDDLYYDASRRRIYASCGEGFIDVFSQTDAGHYVLNESVKTEPGARTSLLAGDRLYLALRRRGNHAAQIWVYRVSGK